jgi:hypothetical protein
MADSTNTTRFHLWLIRFIGLIVPRRLRADWRQEWEAELRPASSITGGYVDNDALIAQPDFIGADRKLRRRDEAQLPIDDGGLQINRFRCAFAFDFGQRVKEGGRRDFLVALLDEFGKGLIETFLAHNSKLLCLTADDQLFPQLKGEYSHKTAESFCVVCR